MRKCIYVAGAINAPSAGKFLNNLRKGIQLSKDVFVAGFAPFSPFIDFHYNLVMNNDEVKSLTTEDYYEYSMAWLMKSDAVILVPGWENSVGTQKELKKAYELSIPVYHDLKSLIDDMGV